MKDFKIPVLMYHRIISKKEDQGNYPQYIFDTQFEEQLNYFKENNYKSLFLSELKDKKIISQEKYFIITIDDGYLDNYEVALPLLKKYGFKANIFILPDTEYNHWDFNKSKNPEKKFQLMDKEIMKKMLDSKLIEFGGHTQTHCDLTRLSLEDVKREIVHSKLKLEKELDIKMTSFSYPYGFYNEEIKKIVIESGFSLAVITDYGVYDKASDLYAIKRIPIYPYDSLKTFEKKIQEKHHLLFNLKKFIKRYSFLYKLVKKTNDIFLEKKIGAKEKLDGRLG